MMFLLDCISVLNELIFKYCDQIMTNKYCIFQSANHSDEPLRAEIVSAKASTISESHLHCLKWNLHYLFVIICSSRLSTRPFKTEILHIISGFFVL